MAATSRIVLLLVLLGMLAGPAAAQTAEQRFQAGNACMEAGDAAGALREYLAGLEQEPESPELLFNGGLAAYLTGDFAGARALWTRYRKVQPADPRGLTKLIQANQALGDTKAAAAGVAELRNWWKSGRTPSLSKETSFVRAQFTAGERRVYAFEFYDPNPAKRDHTWDFVVTPEGSSAAEMMLYVMQDEMAAEISGGEMWFLDVRYPEGGGRTLTTFTYRPSFEEALTLVQDFLAGKKPPLLRQKRR